MTVVTLKLHPAWRNAEAELIKSGFTYGSQVSRCELGRLFGLRDPVTAEEQQAYNLEFMRHSVHLRDSLLVNHMIALKTRHGESIYEAVMPENQTDFAMNTGIKEVKKAMRNMANVLQFTPIHLLTSDQQRKNADAQAKVAMLQGMVRKKALR